MINLEWTIEQFLARKITGNEKFVLTLTDHDNQIIMPKIIMAEEMKLLCKT